MNKILIISALVAVMILSTGYHLAEVVQAGSDYEIGFNSPDAGQRDRDRTNVFSGLIRNYTGGFSQYLGYAIGAAIVVLISWMVIEFVNWIRKWIDKNKRS